ncbi:MAG: cell wall-active antibiotics response protein [Chloroflexi bacterium]|nr:cell wall-active antibiotics response protein [Chloroflexota bacterium]MBU1746899.1 cell wall-active antibiotics response protein [Chloroflexota bacterium]MBU1879686.1 cell wall-active antibiotics response protein [Chloroflexota bacterium]
MRNVRWGVVVMGVLLIVAGVVLLGGSLGLWHISTDQTCGLFFAFMLVGAGLWTIIMVVGAQRGGEPLAQRTLGDQRLSLTDTEFTSRAVSTWIGSTRIDLCRAVFPEGESTLTVATWIGDAKVHVPADLAVRVRGQVAFVGDMNLLGQRRSGFALNVTASTPDYEQAPRRLFVDASTVIGDIKVRRTD